MMRMCYRHGDVLFREGDPSDFVLRVIEGSVEIVKELGERGVTVGTVKAGDTVGEMGVIEKKPRSATVRAAGSVVAEIIPGDDFLKVISGDNTAALNLLVRLSEKLRAVSEEYAHATLAAAGAEQPAAAATPAAPEIQPPAPYAVLEAVPEPAASPAPPAAETVTPAAPVRRSFPYAQVGLHATTRNRLSLLLPDGLGGGIVPIRDLPFFVGREGAPGTPSGSNKSILRLPDRVPYRLSAVHFCIDRSPKGRVLLRDLGSELGTSVNGEFLGGHFSRDMVELSLGDNSVIAGGVGSPFEFLIRVG